MSESDHNPDSLLTLVPWALERRYYLTDRPCQIGFEELLRLNTSLRKRLMNRRFMLLGLATRKHGFDHERAWDGRCRVQLCDTFLDLASCKTYL
jgi:hypothetical protein